MPTAAPDSPTKRRPLAIGLGATECMYLIGLAMLAAAVSLLWSTTMALLVSGAILLFTAFFNAVQRERGRGQ